MNAHSRMRLERAIVSSLSLELKSEFTEQNLLAAPHAFIDEQISCKIKFTTRKHVDSERRWLTLSVATSSKTRFERVAIDVEGVFAFHDEMTNEDIEKYFPLLCLTSLYGFARGIIFQSTGATPGGPLLLPLVDMTQVVNRKAKLKTKAKHA